MKEEGPAVAERVEEELRPELDRGGAAASVLAVVTALVGRT